MAIYQPNSGVPAKNGCGIVFIPSIRAGRKNIEKCSDPLSQIGVDAISSFSNKLSNRLGDVDYYRKPATIGGGDGGEEEEGDLIQVLNLESSYFPIPNGPFNNGEHADFSGWAVFSVSQAEVSVKNISESTEVTLNSVDWTGDLFINPGPVSLNVTISAGETKTIRFGSYNGGNQLRSGNITITYNNNKTFTYTYSVMVLE